MKARFIALILVLGWFIPPSASAGVAITSTNTRWEKAAKLGVITEPTQLFGALGSTGDARFYQFIAIKAGSLNVTINVPVWSDPKFHPQLIVYQPEAFTLGPALPVAQPPSTLALVYPLSEKDRHFEAWTQISAVQRLETTIDVPVPGTYYLAVYNAGNTSGRFRLTIIDPAGRETTTLLSWPKCWWVSHIWANPSITTLFAPLVLIALIVSLLWTHLHWSKQPRQLKKTRTRKK